MWLSTVNPELAVYAQGLVKEAAISNLDALFDYTEEDLDAEFFVGAGVENRPHRRLLRQAILQGKSAPSNERLV